jgi:DNA-binding GntR family transcriptional regulator
LNTILSSISQRKNRPGRRNCKKLALENAQPIKNNVYLTLVEQNRPMDKFADTPLMSIDRKTVQQSATERIRRAILDGVFKPNERLKQADLAERLNISRIPTREALRVLEAEGLVTNLPHRGTTVSIMTSDEISEVYEIRIMLEIRAAQLAMRKMTDAQLNEITLIHSRMSQIEELDEWVQWNKRFHHAMVSPSGWTKLMSVTDMLRNLTAPYMRLYVSTREDRRHALEEHGEIVAALIAKDSDALRNAVRKHLSNSCQSIILQLSNAEEKDQEA